MEGRGNEEGDWAGGRGGGWVGGWVGRVGDGGWVGGGRGGVSRSQSIMNLESEILVFKSYRSCRTFLDRVSQRHRKDPGSTCTQP